MTENQNLKRRLLHYRKKCYWGKVLKTLEKRTDCSLKKKQYVVKARAPQKKTVPRRILAGERTRSEPWGCSEEPIFNKI